MSSQLQVSQDHCLTKSHIHLHTALTCMCIPRLPCPNMPGVGLDLQLGYLADLKTTTAFYGWLSQKLMIQTRSTCTYMYVSYNECRLTEGYSSLCHGWFKAGPIRPHKCCWICYCVVVVVVVVVVCVCVCLYMHNTMHLKASPLEGLVTFLVNLHIILHSSY